MNTSDNRGKSTLFRISISSKEDGFTISTYLS
jgi:hypothetical protein